MSNEPFFRRAGDAYQPTPSSRGPWSETSLHGRVVAGLLAHVIEQRYGAPEFMPARFTVDMYRLPDLSAAGVTVTPIREGNRIKVIDAEYLVDGVSMARATCVFLRKTQNPEGNVWTPPNWDAPLPKDIQPPQDARNGMGGMWATRPISGGFGVLAAEKKLWMSEVRDLVDGEAWTPFGRVAVAADFASPFANSGDQGLGWINADITLYLHRLPVTEWIGFEVKNHGATDGVAVGECWLHDEAGAIGTSSVTALAQRRRTS
ncbi:MAG TPA: acyl-CoA thioesterase domain-containing protein [Caulobacteraceae bacterium]|nr:acyl-CoA thioesterase domain-containing protein [Caulobacteraceae bacterium]